MSQPMPVALVVLLAACSGATSGPRISPRPGSAPEVSYRWAHVLVEDGGGSARVTLAVTLEGRRQELTCGLLPMVSDDGTPPSCQEKPAAGGGVTYRCGGPAPPQGECTAALEGDALVVHRVTWIEGGEGPSDLKKTEAARLAVPAGSRLVRQP